MERRDMTATADAVSAGGGARASGERARAGAPGHDRPVAAAHGAAELSFDAVYEAHFDFVWRSLRLLGLPGEVLEDAVQDTFSVVARQLGAFEGRSQLTTWLFQILRRVAANHRRTHRRKQ